MGSRAIKNYEENLLKLEPENFGWGIQTKFLNSRRVVRELFLEFIEFRLEQAELPAEKPRLKEGNKI